MTTDYDAHLDSFTSKLLITTTEDLKDISMMLASLFNDERMEEVLITAHFYDITLSDLNERQLELIDYLEEFSIGEKRIHDEQNDQEVYHFEYDFQKDFIGKSNPYIFFSRLSYLFSNLDALQTIRNELFLRLLSKIIYIYPGNIVAAPNSTIQQTLSILKQIANGIDIKNQWKKLIEIKEGIRKSSEKRYTTLLGRLFTIGEDQPLLEDNDHDIELEKILEKDLLFLDNINLFLHCMRHPKNSNALINDLLDYYANKVRVLFTYLPACSEKGHYYTVVTVIDENANREFARKYWEIYSAVVHRIIGYGVIKKFKLRNHVEVNSFVQYGHSFNNDTIMKSFSEGSKLVHQRVSDFWTNSDELRDIYRIQILQRRQKNAERSLHRKLTKQNEKTLRRRKRRVREFVQTVMLNNLPFIIETNYIGGDTGTFKLEKILENKDDYEQFQNEIGDGSAALIGKFISSISKNLWNSLVNHPDDYQSFISAAQDLFDAWEQHERFPSISTLRKQNRIYSMKQASLLLSQPVDWYSNLVQQWLIDDPIGSYYYDQQVVMFFQELDRSKRDINIPYIAKKTLMDFFTSKVILALTDASKTMIAKPLLPLDLKNSPWIESFFDEFDTDSTTEILLNQKSMELLPYLNNPNKTLYDAVRELEQGPLAVQILIKHLTDKLHSLPDINTFSKIRKKKAAEDAEVLYIQHKEGLLENPYDIQEIAQKGILSDCNLSEVLSALTLLRINHPETKTYLDNLQGIVPTNENLILTIVPQQFTVARKSEFDIAIDAFYSAIANEY